MFIFFLFLALASSLRLLRQHDERYAKATIVDSATTERMVAAILKRLQPVRSKQKLLRSERR
jgi:hypothetical protein